MVIFSLLRAVFGPQSMCYYCKYIFSRASGAE